MEQLTASTATNLSAQITMFNTMTFQFYNSYDFTRSTLASYLVKQQNNPSDSSIEYQTQNSIDNFMMITLSAHYHLEKLNLYTSNGKVYSKHSDLTDTLGRWDKLHKNILLKSADDLNGGIVLHSQKDNQFSLIRKTHWGESDLGYLEAELKPTTIIDLDKLKAIKGASIVILYEDQVIFSSDGDMPLARRLLSPIDQAESSDYYTVKQSTEDGQFYIGAIIPQKQYDSPLHIFRNVMALTVLFIIMISVAFYYFLAKLLTKPITSLKQAMNQVVDDEHELQLENKYRLNEIESLRRSFTNMNVRLKHSMDEKMQFQALQLQSHYQTLQAQINPHFLFNMLSVITIMADKKDSAAASVISRKLTQFMSYSISSQSSLATLEQELVFTENYLNLMKARYMHRLDYVLDVSDQLHSIMIPKLTIQPIVENSIQHGLREEIPQLIIQVCGKIVHNQWEIVIRDNGIGFSETALEELTNKIDTYMDRISQNDGTGQPVLTLGGMGLISTLARLKLQWKQHFHYAIENHAEGGAVITLHGTLNHQENQGAL
jgi:two-component system sensor histidine kinase YesM